MAFTLEMLARLVLACVLGGAIGYEREHTNRPAGFRTHILVCVGAALVMVTSEFVFRQYFGKINIDPTRMGAQVISGIGFLGAGTIIREGFNVKGLTTAASLWAVSCVGIAAGGGFYLGAVAATVLIYITLIVLKKIEAGISKKNPTRYIYVHSDNIPGQVGNISCVFDQHELKIRHIEFITNENDGLLAKFTVKGADPLSNKHAICDLQGMKGIRRVYEE